MASAAARGDITPLPSIAHDMGSVAAALRQMSQARHVGKVVVRAPDSHREMQPTGSVVVTGAGAGGRGALALTLSLHGGTAALHAHL